MAEVKTNAVRIVETHGAAYTLHSYPCKEAIDGVTVAQKLGADVKSVFKTLVTQGKSNAYFVFVIPADAELDLKKTYVTRIDKSAEAQSAIYVSAGRIGQQMEIAPKSLAEIAGALFDDLTMV